MADDAHKATIPGRYAMAVCRWPRLAKWWARGRMRRHMRLAWQLDERRGK